MNKLSILTLIASTLVLFSGCEKEIIEQPEPSINLETLIEAVINKDIETVICETNCFTYNLTPAITTEDEIGHKANFEKLINTLNNNTKKMIVKLNCYACIKTYPLQTELEITVDSLGVKTNRIIMVLTPEDNILEFTNIY